MTFYDLIRNLKWAGYTFVKKYRVYEIWEKDGKQYSIPDKPVVEEFYYKGLFR